MKTLFSLSSFVFAISCFIGSLFAAEISNKDFALEVNELTIKGTISYEETTKGQPLVVFIAGSGPTNRDGNSAHLINNHLKLLGEALNQKGIATLRYDKRSIGESTSPKITEQSLRFDHFIEDAVAIANQMKKDQRFTKVYILGHSQGSLVGMLAAQKANIDGYISVNGPSMPADELIKIQLESSGLPPAFIDEAKMIFSALKRGETVQHINPGLQSIFRESVQPFLLSWIKYNPSEEIAKLKCKVMIVQGGKDIQVAKNHGDQLAKSAQTPLCFFENMNHILKDIDGGLQDNRMSYANPSLPVNKELVEKLAAFILEKD